MWKWTFAVSGRLHKIRMIFITLIFGNVPDILLQLALITIIEMWGLESRSRSRTSRSRSRSRLLWQSLDLGLVSKFEPGLGLGGYGLDYITDTKSSQRELVKFKKKALNVEPLLRIKRSQLPWSAIVKNVPRKIDEASLVGYTHGKAASNSSKNQVEWLHLRPCLVLSWCGARVSRSLEKFSRTFCLFCDYWNFTSHLLWILFRYSRAAHCFKQTLLNNSWIYSM